MSKFYEELDLIRKHIKEEPKKPNKVLYFIDEVVLGGIGRFFTAIFFGIVNALCFAGKAILGLFILLICVSVFFAIIKIVFGVFRFGLGI